MGFAKPKHGLDGFLGITQCIHIKGRHYLSITTMNRSESIRYFLNLEAYISDNFVDFSAYRKVNTEKYIS